MDKKNVVTKVTMENLAAELRKKFKSQNDEIGAAIKSGKVTGNKVELFSSKDMTGAAAFSFNFPAELFLDQAKTTFVPKFAWAEETYPGSENPKMEGKPVMVLAVKGEEDSTTYSFLSMAALVDTYKAKAEGKDGSTTVTIAGYEVDVKVNISAEEGNILQLNDDGLFVPDTPVKVEGAEEGNLLAAGANGSLVDSGIDASTVLTLDDIVDYTAEEIAAMLADDGE